MVQLKKTKSKSHSKSTWADAMRTAVAVARKINTSEEDFLQGVIEELQPLKLRAMIMLIDEDGQLNVKVAHSRLEKVVRRATGQNKEKSRRSKEMISLCAVINENLCVGCGACSRICSQGAIMMRQREVSQTHTSDRLCELENKLRKLKKRLEGIKCTMGQIKEAQ